MTVRSGPGRLGQPGDVLGRDQTERKRNCRIKRASPASPAGDQPSVERPPKHVWARVVGSGNEVGERGPHHFQGLRQPSRRPSPVTMTSAAPGGRAVLRPVGPWAWAVPASFRFHYGSRLFHVFVVFFSFTPPDIWVGRPLSPVTTQRLAHSR